MGDERSAETYVLATEPEGDSGTSITNMVEYLAATVMEENGLAKIILIEHYEFASRGGHEYDLATFKYPEPRWELSGGVWRRTLGPPTWQALGKEQVELLLGSLAPHREPDR